MPSHPHLSDEDFEQAIADAARCRATRAHRMEIIPSPDERRPLFGSLITYRCELCGMLRYDTVSRLTGDILQRNYDPPAWYTAANDGRHEPAWWRATWWSNLDPSLFLDAETGGHVTGTPAMKAASKPSEVVPIRRKRRA